VEELSTGQSDQAFNIAFDLQRELYESRERVASLLYEAIGRIQDDGQRKHLLRLKRDLYNLRSAESKALSVAQGTLGAGASEITRFADLLAQHSEALKGLNATYLSEASTARQRFQSFMQEESFQRGLLISSKSLYRAQKRYMGSVSADLSGKQDKIERGLLRYYTRAAMKATPFGTFCAVVPGRVVPSSSRVLDLGTGIALSGSPTCKRSVISLNKSLYGILLSHLSSRSGVRHRLPVEMNPTVSEEEGQFLFLTAKGTREVFQRMPRHDVLDIIDRIVSRNGQVTLGDLINALTNHPDVETSREEAEQYLDQLVDIGLLRFRTGVREQELQWDLPLRALLDGTEDHHAEIVVDTLTRLRALVDEFQEASLARRSSILTECEQALHEAFASLGIEERTRTGLPLYEDATADVCASVGDASVIRPIAEALSAYLDLTHRLAQPRKEQAAMRHFFDTYYGRVGSIPLLRFYEDYYREHFKPHLEAQSQARYGDEYDSRNPFDLQLVTAIQRAYRLLQGVVVKRWAENPAEAEIELSRSDLAASLEEVPDSTLIAPSMTVFGQVVCDLDAVQPSRFILRNGAYATGYGKYFSRFLYLFPEAVRNDLFMSNESREGIYLAEICGDGNFNGNLHPPLLPREISYPTGESGHADEQLLTSDLCVEAAADDPYALRLRHGPSGRIVLPVDLGFLNPTMRPPLYQLLSQFTPIVGFSFPFPRSAALHVEDGEPASGGDTEVASSAPSRSTQTANPRLELTITRRPRITFEGTLVLARQCWFVPGPLLPQYAQGESAFDFYVRVNQWRLDHELPREVYVRLQPLPRHRTHGNDGKAEASPLSEGSTEVLAERNSERTLKAANTSPSDRTEPSESEGDSPEALHANNRLRPKQTRGSRDLYKPQYIDFANPLLANLFGKMARGLGSFSATLEERYPTAKDLPHYEGVTHAAEQIFQLDVTGCNPAKSAAIDSSCHDG
jgi:hypothetical protein